MPITKPTLRPKCGYVEVENNGVRTYKNISTGELIENEKPVIPTLEEQIASLQIQLSNTQDVIDALLFE